MNKKNLATIVVFLGAGMAAVGGLLWLQQTRVPTHTVAQGETLVEIAARYGVSVSNLVAWNTLGSDPLQPGQHIVLAAREKTDRPMTGAATGVGAMKPFPKPQPERCLGGPTLTDLPEDDEDLAMAANQGLDEEQVQVSMGSFTPRLFVCVPSGYKPNGTIDLAITVGCDGIVRNVDVEDDTGHDTRPVS